MTTRRLVSKLLKFKGFLAVSFWWERRGRDFLVAVKPHRNGARCPKCGCRGKIVRTLEPRRWRDVRVKRSGLCIVLEKSVVARMAKRSR